jgi:hypothetical protein
MEDPRILIAALALLAYALLSRRLDRWWFSMPVVMALVGLIVGGAGLGWLGVDVESETVKIFARSELGSPSLSDCWESDCR